MTDEQRAGYALAMKYGAKKTAALIRANKASVGRAIISACEEIGVDQVTIAIEESENPWWALCAIRYAPRIQWWHRALLSTWLTDEQHKYAAWVLTTFSHLSKDEIKILKWVSQLAH